MIEEREHGGGRNALRRAPVEVAPSARSGSKAATAGRRPASGEAGAPGVPRDCPSSRAFGVVLSHPVEPRWRSASGPVSTDRQPPPAAVEEAKRKPNGWVYEIVGGEEPDGGVPPERIRGAWQVNAAGEIVGQFTPNPRFVEPAG
jgi:hypothetical protein